MDGTSLLPSLHPWGRCRSCTPAAGPNKSCCAHLSLFHHSTCFSAATINTSGGIKLVSAEKFFTSVTMTVIGTADISCTTTSGYPLKKTRQIIVNTMHHQIYYPLQQSLTVSPLEDTRVLPLLNVTFIYLHSQLCYLVIFFSKNIKNIPTVLTTCTQLALWHYPGGRHKDHSPSLN